MDFCIKKSRFKEPKWADRGYLLNQDFTVQWILRKPTTLCQSKVLYKAAGWQAIFSGASKVMGGLVITYFM